MTSAQGQALDHYLHTQFEVIRLVHDELPAIIKVARGLTPVEDLLDFQEQIAALHAKLGLLVEASEHIVQASDFGLSLLKSVDAAAARLLLQLKSAGLHDAEYFATQANFEALGLLVAELQVQVNELVGMLATLASKTELELLRQQLTDRLDAVEGIAGPGGNGNGLAGLGGRIDQLLLDLENGAWSGTVRADIDRLEARIGTIDGGMEAWAQVTTELDARLVSLDGNQATQATALQQLSVRVTATEAGVTSSAEQVTALTTRVGNTESGLEAESTARQVLASRTGALEGTVESQASQLTQLTSEINDLELGVQQQATATQGLTTRVTQTEQRQTSTSQAVTGLTARITDAEVGIVAVGTAVDELSTTVTQTQDALTVVSEDVTRLSAGVTSAGNLLSNAGFDPDIAGWTFFSKGLGWLTGVLSKNLSEEVYLPPGVNALSLTVANVPAGAAGVRSLNVPIEPGLDYLVSGYLAGINCTSRLEWRLLDLAGEEVGFGVVGQSLVPPSTSRTLRDWERVFAAVPAPLGAASLQLQWWVDECHTADPSAWLLRPMVEEMVPGQVNPSPWVPGTAGAVTALAEAIETLTTRVEQTEDAIRVGAEQTTVLSARLDLVDNTLMDFAGDISAQGEAIQELDTRVDATEAGLTAASTAATDLSNQLVVAMDLAGRAAQQANSTRISTEELGTRLGEIAADILLTPNEKPPLISEWDSIKGEIAGLRAQANAYLANNQNSPDIQAALTNLNTAYDALEAYLNGLLSPVPWNNLTGNTLLN